MSLPIAHVAPRLRGFFFRLGLCDRVTVVPNGRVVPRPTNRLEGAVNTGVVGAVRFLGRLEVRPDDGVRAVSDTVVYVCLEP